MDVYCKYGLWEMLILAVPFICILVYWHYKHYFTYWERKGVYTTKPNLIFGNAQSLILQKENVAEVFAKVYKDSQKHFQSFGGFYFFTKPVLVLSDLTLIKQIMITDFQYFTDRVFYFNENEPLSLHLVALKGSRWKNMRSKLAPLFAPAKIKALIPNIANYTKQLVSTFNNLVPKTGCIEIHDIIRRCSINIIVSSAFGLESNVSNNEYLKFQKCGENFWNTSVKDSFIRLLTFVFPEIVLKLGLKVIGDDDNWLFINTITNIMKDVSSDKNCFMHTLLQMRSKTARSGVDSKLDLTTLDLAAQSYIFFIAGFETTTTLISFCLYELAIHTVCQEKVRDEVQTVLNEDEDEFTFATLTKMTYLEQCIKETLRLHPPTTVIRRECTQSYNIPNTGVTIEKGTYVFIPVLGIHTDTKLYSNPQKFDPERFVEENIVTRHPCAWIPFGYGQRMCIGYRFSLVQAKIVVAQLVKNFKLTLSPLTKVPLLYDPKAFLLKPINGIWLKFEKLQH